MFKNAKEATTARGIPLVLAESSETVRKQTLEWVSHVRFNFFRYLIPLTGFKTGFFRQGVVSSQLQSYQWQFKWNANWNAGRQRELYIFRIKGTYLFLNICFCCFNSSHLILGHHPSNICSAASSILLPSHSDSASHLCHQQPCCTRVLHKPSSLTTLT